MTAVARRRAPKAKSHVARAHRYARDVCAGKILACKWVRLACARHLKDLERARGADFPFRFDVKRAERSCRFAELFPHVKGEWAKPDPLRPDAVMFRLSDWQRFIRCSLKGWVEKKTGLRRFRVSYVEVPRKNGKSFDAAIHGLEGFVAEGEPGAEVYSGATTEYQAWETFRPARLAALATPAFLEQYGVAVHASNLAAESTGCRFEPVIGKPGDGASPSLAIVDEYHEHLDSVLYDTMITGMGARRQPLMFVITTAGTDTSGPCYALREIGTRVLEGTEINERLFVIIYTIDEEDDWTSETALRKANPNYGISVKANWLRDRQAEAIRSSRDQAVFKTKHLNIWVTASLAWLNMEWWHRQADAPPIAEFAGEPCWVGLDLASKLDLAAKALIFQRQIDGQPHFYFYARCYVPRATVEDPRNRHYQGWVHDEFLTATDGDMIDQELIKQELLADAGRFEIRSLGFDQWNSAKLIQELMQEGLNAVEIPQTVKFLSEPMKQLEAAAKAGRIHHDGNPCYAWQMSNVTCKPDRNDNIFPRRERAENKIDAAIATLNAMSRALLEPPPSSEAPIRWL